MSHIRKICVSALLYYTYILNAEVNVTKIEYDGDNIASVPSDPEPQGDELASRNPKIFSIFSVVQFKNLACTSTMTVNRQTTGNLPEGSRYRNGTCMTEPECTQKGGSESGTCAGGFGICCVFMISTCGSTISQNCSYIKNPGFPSALSDLSQCKYTIAKCDSSVCDFRLDFESFDISPPSVTDETTDGHACRDVMQAMVNTGSATSVQTVNTVQTFNAIPEICGNNQGQHLYLDVGTLPSDTAMITFTFDSDVAAGDFSRFWDIKVTQIPCRSKYDPPPGCLQWHTGIDGKFETFNFPGTTTVQHLQNQDYRVCIRQEEGYCGIQYCACTEENSMSLAADEAGSIGTVGSNCEEDWVEIEGSSCSGTANPALFNRYCGEFFTHTPATTIAGCCIVDCNGPFQVGFHTEEGQEGTGSDSNRGTCINYTQLPCGAVCGNP